MVDALDSKSSAIRRVGSSPSAGKSKPGNIMAVCGPAKSEVAVQFRPWSRGSVMELVDIPYLGCGFCGFESHQGYYPLFV